MKTNFDYKTFPPRCCMRCKNSPNIDPDYWDKYIGTPIHCQICDVDMMPTDLCSYFTLPTKDNPQMIKQAYLRLEIVCTKDDKTAVPGFMTFSGDKTETGDFEYAVGCHISEDLVQKIYDLLEKEKNS